MSLEVWNKFTFLVIKPIHRSAVFIFLGFQIFQILNSEGCQLPSTEARGCALLCRAEGGTDGWYRCSAGLRWAWTSPWRGGPGLWFWDYTVTFGGISALVSRRRVQNNFHVSIKFSASMLVEKGKLSNTTQTQHTHTHELVRIGKEL